MNALTWQSVGDVRVDTVPDPTIQEPTDIIIRITSTGLCGSDLHLYTVLGPFLDAEDCPSVEAPRPGVRGTDASGCIVAVMHLTVDPLIRCPRRTAAVPCRAVIDASGPHVCIGRGPAVRGLGDPDLRSTVVRRR
jgi:threonine dehydrogenase-like Zn-dependent dehydrogenase